MSMKTYPLVQNAAFPLDDMIAAHIALASARANSSVPDRIAGLSPSEFAKEAWEGRLPKSYYDWTWLETTEDNKFVPSFDGVAETLFPEKANVKLGMSFSSSPICYIPAAQTANPSKTAHASPEGLLNEFKKNTILAQLNRLEGFDWWRNIVGITGTALAEEDV